MSRLLPLDIEYLNFLKLIPKKLFWIYFTQEEALDLLRRSTKQDFGDDAESWKEWILNNCHSHLRELLEPPVEIFLDDDEDDESG